MFHRYLIILFFTLFSFHTLQAERFLYVNDFKNILDNPSRRVALLAYAQSHQITELILYELHLVNNVHNLSNAVTNQILADFIKTAKTNYGITRMSAAGGGRACGRTTSGAWPERPAPQGQERER